MFTYILIAARNLVQARRRTMLLGGALAGVTVLLVVLQALSTGITRNLVESATILSTGHVNVGGFYKTTPSDAAPVVLEVDKVRKIVEENTPGLAFMIDRHRGWAKLVSDTHSIFAGPTGIDAKQETRLQGTLVLAKESDYREGGSAERKGDLSKLGTPGSMVLFAGQAKRLEAQVGDEITISSQSFDGVSNSASATVVAIVEDLGMLSMFSVFVPKEMLTKLYQLRDDTTGAVQIYLHDIEQSSTVAEHLRKVFQEKGYEVMDPNPQAFWMKFEPIMAEDWTGQKLDLTIWSDEVSFVNWIVAGLNALSAFLIGVLLFIIGFGIMNAMWISVRERTGEIGTLRAIGMGRRKVLTMFMTEAFLLGLAGTVVGAVVGTLLAGGMNALAIKVANPAVRMILLSDTVRLAVTPGSIILALVLFTIVSGLAALWPALRAAKMQPVTAIQAVT